MSERLAQSLLLGAILLLPVKAVQAEPAKDPIYVKTSTGWNAAYAHGNEAKNQKFFASLKKQAQAIVDRLVRN